MNKVMNVSRLPRCLLILATVALMLNACSSMTSTPSVQADASARWALLPLNNLSQTPQADVQAITMMETQLRARGVTAVQSYSPLHKVSLRELMNPALELQDSMAWAKKAGFRYGMTGTINEWHYKSGGDKEPVVGINLKILDLFSNQVLWQGNAARTGWGYANLPAIADSVIADLLSKVELVAPR